MTKGTHTTAIEERNRTTNASLVKIESQYNDFGMNAGEKFTVDNSLGLNYTIEYDSQGSVPRPDGRITSGSVFVGTQRMYNVSYEYDNQGRSTGSTQRFI